jgi:hypothetical protein
MEDCSFLSCNLIVNSLPFHLPMARFEPKAMIREKMQLKKKKSKKKVNGNMNII